MSANGFDYQNVLSPEEEQSIGLPAGWAGEFGWPKLLENLRRLKEEPWESTWKVIVSVESQSFRADVNHPRPKAAERALRDLGAVFDSGAGLGWKEAVWDGTIAKLPALLENERVIFVGATRTWKFAKAIGVSKEDFIAIADFSSYDQVPELRHKVANRMNHSVNKGAALPLIGHSAGLAGRVLLTELALDNLQFVGVDFGLAAAIYDDEYIANRPWFKGKPESFVTARRELETRKPPRLWHRTESEAKHISALTEWSELRNSVATAPLESTARLGALLRSTPRRIQTEVLQATYWIWEYFYNQEIVAPLDQTQRQWNKIEPLLSISAILSLEGKSEAAANFLKKAMDLVGSDPRFPAWADAIKIQDDFHESGKANWARTLTMATRPDLGSWLSWSLDGDLPSGRGLA